MKTIWKFPLTIADEVSVLVPPGAKPLTVQLQGTIPYLWAIVDPDAKLVTRLKILWRGTGQPLTGDEGAHLGTVQLAGLVFHAFAEIEQ